MREGPSLSVIRGLLERGATVCAYDPVASKEARRALNGLEGLRYANSADAALDGCDALIIVTEWKEFRSPDFTALRSSLRSPVVFDGRNLFDPAFAQSEGIEYHAVGRLQPSTAAR
jgi:UDPglucose 6-dehydrogenase